MKKLTWALGILILLFVLLIIGVKIFAMIRIQPKLAAIAQETGGLYSYEIWAKKRLQLPPEAFEATPFPPELLQKAEAYTAAAVNVDLNFLHPDKLKPIFNERDAPLPLEELQAAQPLIEQYKSTVAETGFEMSVFQNFMPAQNGAKLLALDAIRLAREGRCDDARTAALLLLRGTRTHPFSTLITQLVGIGIGYIAVNVNALIVAACNDPEFHNEMLRDLNAQAPDFHIFNARFYPTTIDLVGQLRELQRAGVRVPNYQGRSERELQALVYAATANQLGKKGNLTPQEQKMLKSYRNMSSMLAGGGAYAMLFPVHEAMLKTLFAVAAPNFLEAKTRDSVVMARFDLLRLELARRIVAPEADGPPTAEQLSELFPEALPSDRFSGSAPNREAPVAGGAGATYPFRDFYYSVGPDTQDDQAMIVYDPTNGTTSRGDIWLEMLADTSIQR